MATKKYGLILPKKSKGVVSSIKKPSVFEDSSSDEEVDGRVRGKVYSSTLWRENKKNAMQTENHGAVIKALEEDPNVFDYDGQYDKIQEQKRKSDPRLLKKDRTSKYISKLKQVADRRKLEQDIIYERKVQREMEQEGTEYGDKDTFLTSAYRQKLEERKQLEEELKIAAKKEEAEDVTKQVDISRFHRTLLNKMTDKEDRSKVTSGESGEERRNEEGVSAEDKQEDQSRLSSGEESPTRSPEQSTGGDMTALGESGRRGEEEAPGSVERESGSDVGASVEDMEAASLFPPTVDKEKRRKMAATKRTNEDSLHSAKERFLARKKAKLTAPVISDD